jgi:hypothetical protein
MDTLETAFGVVVIVLAALAVIGALVFAVVWEVCAIKRTLATRHGPPMQPPTWWRERAAAAPTIPQRRKWS